MAQILRTYTYIHECFTCLHTCTSVLRNAGHRSFNSMLYNCVLRRLHDFACTRVKCTRAYISTHTSYLYVTVVHRRQMQPQDREEADLGAEWGKAAEEGSLQGGYRLVQGMEEEGSCHPQ